MKFDLRASVPKRSRRVVRDSVELEPAASCKLPFRPVDHAVAHGGSHVIVGGKAGRVLLFTCDLKPVADFDTQAPLNGVALESGGRRLAAVGPTALTVFDDGGNPTVGLEFDGWDSDCWCSWASCVFLHRTRELWAAVPNADRLRTDLVVVAPETGTILARRSLPNGQDVGTALSAHPDGEDVVVWSGAGQEGQWMYIANRHRSTIRLTRRLSRMAPQFITVSPTGRKFLALDHDSDWISLHRYPDGRRLGELSRTIANKDLCLDPGDAIDEVCCWLSESLALVHTDRGRVGVLDVGSMRITDSVVFRGDRPRRLKRLERNLRYGEIRDIRVLPGDRLLTYCQPISHRGCSLKVWAMPPSFHELREVESSRKGAH